MPLYRAIRRYENGEIRLFAGDIARFDTDEADQINRDSPGVLVALGGEELDALNAAIAEGRRVTGVDFDVDWDAPAAPANEERGRMPAGEGPEVMHSGNSGLTRG